LGKKRETGVRKRLWQSASESTLYSKGKEKNRTRAKAKEKTLPLDLSEELLYIL